MDKLIKLLARWASGKVVVGFLVPTMVVYLVMLFYTIPAVERFAPGVALFDLSPGGYSYEHAITLLEGLGAEGRSVYLNLQLPMDFIYPGLFAIAYSLLLTWVFSKGFAASSRMFYFALVPILAGLFDYLENIGIWAMLTSYPNVSQSLVTMASVFTVLKSGFSMMFFILVFMGGVQLIKTRITAGDSQA